LFGKHLQEAAEAAAQGCEAKFTSHKGVRPSNSCTRINLTSFPTPFFHLQARSQMLYSSSQLTIRTIITTPILTCYLLRLLTANQILLSQPTSRTAEKPSYHALAPPGLAASPLLCAPNRPLTALPILKPLSNIVRNRCIALSPSHRSSPQLLLMPGTR